MSGVISVNSVKYAIEEHGSLTAGIETSAIYSGKHRIHAKKTEVNLKVLAREDHTYMMRYFPLFDKEDIESFRDKKYSSKYLHIGCVTVSIEPLIHKHYLKKFGTNIMGICAILDSTFRDLEESIISCHQFDLSKGRVDFMTMPDHCLSLTDVNLLKRITVLILLSNIDVEPGSELFNVCIGHLTTCTNTLNPTSEESKQLTLDNTISKGSKNVEFPAVKDWILAAMEEEKQRDQEITLERNEDTEIVLKQPFGQIRAWFGMPSSKVILRRNYTTNPYNILSCQGTYSSIRREPGVKPIILPRVRDIIGCSSDNAVIEPFDLKEQVRRKKKELMKAKGQSGRHFTNELTQCHSNKWRISDMMFPDSNN